MHAQRLIARALTAVLAGSLSLTAVAGDLDWLLTLGYQHNDNINLSETDPVSGGILIPGLGFTFDQQGSVLQANISGSLEYRDYLNGAFSDSTRARLNGGLNWSMLPRRLDWVFQDSLGSEPVDEFAADAPGNRQQTNAFATGPNLYFGLGKPTHGQLEFRYIDTYAETTSQFNSSRYTGAARLLRDLSPTRHLSANLEVENVNFDKSGAGPDFDRYDVYVGYNAQLRVLDFDLAAGYSRVDYQGIDKQSGGPLLRAGLTWQATDRSRFTGSVTRQFTDAADTLLSTAVPSGTPDSQVSTGDLSINAESYLQKSLQLGYDYSGERLGLSLAPYYRKLEYDNAPDLDRHGSGWLGSISWRLKPLWTVGLTASGENLRYNTLGREDRTRNYGAQLAWQMTRRLSWHLELSHYRRDSSAIGQTSDQNIAYLWVAFRR